MILKLNENYLINRKENDIIGIIDFVKKRMTIILMIYLNCDLNETKN